ncbi:uncharacterized protein [Trachinotus anak]|uniref:uncharacterized protein n=1 Tax=Trachinotus anak TaxID=443729 RepID=UPI0039F1C949
MENVSKTAFPPTKPPWTVTGEFEDEGATEGATSGEERGHIQGRRGSGRGDAGGSGDGVGTGAAHRVIKGGGPRQSLMMSPSTTEVQPKHTPGVQPPLSMGPTQCDGARMGRRRCRLPNRSTPWKCQEGDVPCVCSQRGAATGSTTKVFESTARGATALCGETTPFLTLKFRQTEVIVIGPKHLRDTLCDNILTLDDITLASSATVRNLGVIFDQDLSFTSHIKQVSRTAFFHLHNIAKIRPILCLKEAEKLVHAFVTPRLDYCNSLLSGCPKNSVKSLQLIQNAAARVLTGTRKRDHISPVLASLHWLPVKSRIEFKILLLTYKAINGQAPSYLGELIVPYFPNRTLRSLNAGQLVVPRVCKSRMGGGRAFSYQAPLLWNQLPVWVREADTLSTFKIRLKTVLFSKAYS